LVEFIGPWTLDPRLKWPLIWKNPAHVPENKKGSKPLNPTVYPLPPNYHFQKGRKGRGASIEGEWERGKTHIIVPEKHQPFLQGHVTPIWTLHAK